MNILSPILEFERRQPERVFCEFMAGGQASEVSYGSLMSSARSYAALYGERGLRAGDIVIIVLRHCADLYSAFLGAMMAGCIPSFMPFPSVKQDPVLYWEGHRTLFSRIGVRALVTYPEYKTEIDKHLSPDEITVLFTNDSKPHWSDLDSHFEPSHNDIALLQHSSGTTGLKKGVQLTHGAILNQLGSYATALGIGETDKIASWLPLYHDMGLMACFLLPVVLGIPLVSIDPFEWVMRPSILLEEMERRRCTHAWLPNFAFHHLVRSLPTDRVFDLSHVRAFINCSEPCKAETFRLFAGAMREHAVRPESLQVCYAMAENVFAVTQTPSGEPVRGVVADNGALQTEHVIRNPQEGGPGQEFLSVGRPISGVSVRIVDGARAMLPERFVGEVAISGESLFSGYFKLDEATRLSLEDGWYFTGDLGFLDRGELFITGRKKDLIIVNGRNVYAHDVEFILNGIEGLIPGRSVAFGEYDPLLGTEALIAIAETRADDPPAKAAMKRAAKEQVLSLLDCTIRHVELVPPGWIVKTTSGKISREENAAKYRQIFARKS